MVEPSSVPPYDSPQPATTTHQEDLTKAGQRAINHLWETTQAAIAILVVVANMAVGVYNGIVPNAPEFPSILSSSLFLIVGFYFARTNHSAIGGIGNKPEGPYIGR